MDRIALRHLLVFGNAKLFLLCFLCEVPLKISCRADHQGIGQLVCNGRVLTALFRCLVMDSAAPALHLFQIPVFHKETVIDLHSVLHGADFRNHALQLPYRLDIFFLPCKAFLRRIIPAVILRGGVQPSTTPSRRNSKSPFSITNTPRRKKRYSSITATAISLARMPLSGAEIATMP